MPPSWAFICWSTTQHLQFLSSSTSCIAQTLKGAGATLSGLVTTLVAMDLLRCAYIVKRNMQGAGATLSGLVTMLAAMDLLRSSSTSANYNRRLIFIALAGEPWGYMGSRRLLWEMLEMGPSGQSLGTQGLDLNLIDEVSGWERKQELLC